MIVAFTGGRSYENKAMVEFVLHLMNYCTIGSEVERIEIRVGDCPTGLDSIVRDLWESAMVYEADWSRHGKAAGPIRNREMLTEFRPDEDYVRHVDLLIAFPGNAGTADCVRQARELGIPVLMVPS